MVDYDTAGCCNLHDCCCSYYSTLVRGSGIHHVVGNGHLGDDNFDLGGDFLHGSAEHDGAFPPNGIAISYDDTNQSGIGSETRNANKTFHGCGFVTGCENESDGVECANENDFLVLSLE